MGATVSVFSSHCEVAALITERMGLPAKIWDNLRQLCERWDGHGFPAGLSGANRSGTPVSSLTLLNSA